MLDDTCAACTIIVKIYPGGKENKRKLMVHTHFHLPQEKLWLKTSCCCGPDKMNALVLLDESEIDLLHTYVRSQV